MGDPVWWYKKQNTAPEDLVRVCGGMRDKAMSF